MRLLLAVCFAVAMNAIACAHAVTKGPGAGSCAAFAQASQGNPDLVDIIYLSWAQGYMSGTNSLNKDVLFDLDAKTPDEMKRYLRQYCDTHPLANYGDGVRDLLNTLPTVQPDRK